MNDFIPITDVHTIAINQLCHIVNDWATKKGWNEDELEKFLKKHNAPKELLARLEAALKVEQHALFHTEISESVEGIRQKEQPAMDDKVPSLTAEAAELADTLVRIFHYCGKRGIDLGQALKLKHDFNITRPYKHGKTL